MKRMRLSTARKVGFSKKVLRLRKDHPRMTLHYMKQKSSFFVAAFSLIAFLSGNMLGQHGWYAFWKAALGQYDDTLITYTGTVPPIAFVPDYGKWALYGGNPEENTFKQVPKDMLIPLPPYDQKKEKKGYEGADAGDVYSVGHMGSYKTGGEGDGSHIGVDIRVPEGTPVRSIANGIVTRVAEDPGGFGKLIVIRHPHMPDPDNPEYETVLHSSYSHLSAQFVTEGQVVKKGVEIGLSGQTGFATGPHLHFQVDRDTALWHPYWAFSYTEAKQAGLTTTQAINSAFHQDRGYELTVHPLLLVQANHPPAKYKTEPGTKIVKKPTSVSTTRTRKTLAQAREDRRQQRLANRPAVVATVKPAPVTPVPSPVVVNEQTLVSDTKSAPEPRPVLVVPPKGEVASIDIQHDRRFSGREWETIRLVLLDDKGNTIGADSLTKDVYLRTAYGEAEFKPAVLTPLDFTNGTATVQMLPRGRRTVVITVQPFNILSSPIEYEGN